MKATNITINNECIKILYAINVTCNNATKMGIYISEHSYKDLTTSYHTKITVIPWVKTDKINKPLEENVEGLKADLNTLTNKLTHF